MEAAAEENLESLKRKRVVFGESQLVSNKGLRKVYREFSYQLQGLATGSETKALRELITRYKEWAHDVYPGLAFEDFVQRTATLSRKTTVVETVNEMRDLEATRIYGATELGRPTEEEDDEFYNEEKEIPIAPKDDFPEMKETEFNSQMDIDDDESETEFNPETFESKKISTAEIDQIATQELEIENATQTQELEIDLENQSEVLIQDTATHELDDMTQEFESTEAEETATQVLEDITQEIEETATQGLEASVQAESN